MNPRSRYMSVKIAGDAHAKRNAQKRKGILYRVNRSIQVEEAFGVLKNNYEFQRFLLRGKTKVKLEILLLSFGYNFNKLHAKIQTAPTERHFFEVKTV